MLGDQLCHLKHVHLLLAAKHRFELVISIDVTLILGILKIIFLDVRSFRTMLKKIYLLLFLTTFSAPGLEYNYKRTTYQGVGTSEANIIFSNFMLVF